MTSTESRTSEKITNKEQIKKIIEWLFSIPLPYNVTFSVTTERGSLYAITLTAGNDVAYYGHYANIRVNSKSQERVRYASRPGQTLINGNPVPTVENERVGCGKRYGTPRILTSAPKSGSGMRVSSPITCIKMPHPLFTY